MSILIRGMDEIPEDGAVLMVRHDDNGKAYIKYAGMMGYFMELVKIPEKHGRLIDKDRLKREMLWNFAGEKIPLYDCDNSPIAFHVKDVEITINSQPTVIEAEGTDEGSN